MYCLIILIILQVGNIASVTSTSLHCGGECVPANATEATQCNYIKTCCTDTLEDSLIDYLSMQYCTLNTVQPLGVILLCILVFYAFLILGSVADDFFAPTMAELADSLGVSHELAGVTFVALGNGAPDISSSIAAITMGPVTTKLGLGALLGAAVFDTIAVSGVIALAVHNPEVARKPFLRDCFFLFVAAACVLWITVDQVVTLKEAIGMVSIYILYVTSALLGELYNKLKKARLELEDINEDEVQTRRTTLTEKIMPILNAFSTDSMMDLRTINDGSIQHHTINADTEQHHTMPYHHLQPMRRSSVDTIGSRSRYSSIKKLAAELPDIEHEDEERARWKICLEYIIKGPTILVMMLCKITIPQTDENWNDWIAIASCVTSPLMILFVFLPKTLSSYLGPVPVIALVVVTGFILSAFTYWRIRLKYSTSTNDELEKSLLVDAPKEQQVTMTPMLDIGAQKEKSTQVNDVDSTVSDVLQKTNKLKLQTEPVMKVFFLLLSFVSAVAWISVVANELVNLMTVLGVISTIDLAILGLTVLAWGNSIGDMIADVSVSKRGYAKMGISAAISGPTLNVLIGVGLGTTITTLSSKDGTMAMPNTGNILACCVAVMIGIAIYALWTGIKGWRLHRSFGYFCFVYYFAFLVINVLIYRHVIS